MGKKAVQRPILPVCLLLAGRPCLVVGGGQIAARKVGHLLDAEADVMVVSPAFVADLQTLCDAKRVRVTVRDFVESDVDGKYLVFAATDREDVNRRVIASCRSRHILCSAVDSVWPEGDFVMPAICRKSGLVVTVSTGGRSCRQARIAKDRIAEMLTTLANETSGDDGNADKK